MLTSFGLPTTQCEHEEQDAAAVGPGRNALPHQWAPYRYVLLQQLAQTATLYCVHSVMAQAIVALIIPPMTHELEATTDEHDDLDLSHVAQTRAEGWSPQPCQTLASSS